MKENGAMVAFGPGSNCHIPPNFCRNGHVQSSGSWEIGVAPIQSRHAIGISSHEGVLKQFQKAKENLVGGLGQGMGNVYVSELSGVVSEVSLGTIVEVLNEKRGGTGKGPKNRVNAFQQTFLLSGGLL